ncbi:M-phase inducer phosphatase-like [Haliotis rufescens]|uniref:M-phase inducer phosphatase-like n=1 Tax=Haliotis rufescens TaxID=6454 RepID=UPI00201E8219|nr:M-phase inducer phosphatase-like [Haliotis rufescens]
MSRKQIMFSSDLSNNLECPTSPEVFTQKSLVFDDDNSLDSGFESLGSDIEVSPLPLDHRRTGFHGTRKSLFGQKRRRDDDGAEDHILARQMKKLKTTNVVPKAQTGVTSDVIKSAVDKMEQGTDLIGDGSQNHSLPTIQGRHKDLKSVAPHTVSQLLAGQYDDVISSYRIIDCRYPYEYEGGHIEGAENLHNETLITDLVTSLQGRDSIQRNILVFHCEFSSERGPKLLRCLRNLDRKLNSDRYPFLCYPEVYLLDGGYKAFHEQHQTQCQPRNYVPMLHQDYSKQLRHFRVKSKSWTAGEKQGMRSRRLIIDTSPLKMPLW